MTQSRNYRPRPVPDPPPAPQPLIAPTGSASLDVMADVINQTAAPFQTAPPPEQGALGAVSHGLNAVLGVVGAPFELLDSGFAMATAGIAALVPGMPAATLTAPHLGMPHGHAHPPSLIPPAPPVPLPSIGTVAAAGCVSVLIGGLPAARASDVGPAPTCGSLGPIFEIYTGSSNTFIGGSRAARLTDITRHCNPASALGAFGKAMGAVGVAAGALGAGASAAGGAMAAAAMQAAQAAADAVALAMAAFLGKDPGIPPAMGAIMFGNPTVLIGGFPMPDTLELLGGLVKAAKMLGGAAKKLGKRASNLRRQVCLDPSEPISLVTGEVYNDFEDASIDPQTGWSWIRHYRSGWSEAIGPMGRGFRHLYERRLELRRRRAVFVDYNGVEVDFVRAHDDSPYGGVMFGYVLEQLDPMNFALKTPGNGDQYRFRREHPTSRRARLVEVRPAKGAPFWLEYDRAGRLLRLWRYTLQGNIEARLRYDAQGCIVAIERHVAGEAPATLVRYGYDASGCLVQFHNPYGAEYGYRYAAGRMIRAEDPRGYGFTWTYDHLGRCIACRGDDGLWGVTLEYEIGRTLVHEADGGQWAYHHNGDGVITHVVDPMGGIKQYRTEENGLIACQIDPAGLVTRWLYDRLGHHFGRVDPWGSLLPPENDDPHPATGRELFIPPDPRAMQVGLLEAFEHPVAPQADLDIVAIPSLLHAQVTAVLYAVQQRRAAPVEHFDVAGRTTVKRDAWGAEERTGYSLLGEPVITVDADGKQRRREYGSWSLELCESDPMGAAIRYAYDHRERITAITDPRGHTVRYDRDACGRVEQIWNGDQLEERYAHDLAGRVVTTFDGESRALVEYTYGKHGQCEVRTLQSGEVHRYAYDFRGNISEASSAEVQVKLTYDWDRRVTRDERDGIGVVHRFTRAKPRAAVFAGKFETRYEDDALGFTRITTPDGRVHRFRALPGGSIERIHGDGSHELSHYDGQGRCTGRYVWRDGQEEALWYARYRYSRAGDLQTIEDRFRGTTHFAYDAAHRLTAIHPAQGEVVAFRYDSGGNLLGNRFYPWLRYDARNQLIEGPGESFAYDRRYHLAEHRRESLTVHYDYNSLDCLVRVRWDDGRPDWTAAYDGLGRRLYKAQDGKRTEFYWDGHRLAGEVSHRGALRLYVYPTRDALLPVLFLDYDSMDAEPESGRIYFVFYDQVGLPSHIHDSRGQIVWLARHADPYGHLDLDPRNRIQYDLRFPGHVFDAETGLHYNRFRYYSPRLGRYLQSDPMGQAGGVNVYAYPSNPLVCVDVFGLMHRRKRAASESSGQPKKKPKAEATHPRDMSDAELGAHMDGLAQAMWSRMQDAYPRRVRAPDGTMLSTADSTRGPCLSLVMDRGTGDVHYRQNTGTPAVPRDGDYKPLSSPLQERTQERIDALGPSPEGYRGDGWTRDKGYPGSHSEVQGSDAVLRGREGATMDDVVIYNVRTEDINQSPAPTMVRCDNCKPITEGATVPSD